MLEKIIEDLDINLTQLKMTEAERVETTQKINIVKNIINRFNSTKKKYWETTSNTWVDYKINWRSVTKR